MDMTKKIKKLGLQKLLSLAALVILCVLFATFGQNFLSQSTLVNILDSSYYIGFLAIGVTFVIITGRYRFISRNSYDVFCSYRRGCLQRLAFTNWSMPFYSGLRVELSLDL